MLLHITLRISGLAGINPFHPVARLKLILVGGHIRKHAVHLIKPSALGKALFPPQLFIQAVDGADIAMLFTERNFLLFQRFFSTSSTVSPSAMETALFS